MKKRIEDMTIGEISDQVSKSNDKLEEYEKRVYDQIANEATDKIKSALKPKFEYHKFLPNPSPNLHGCVRCNYSKDHPIHESSS